MTRQEVLKSALDWFKGDELKANIWVDKYCLKDDYGAYLERTPTDMFYRLAHEFARIESNYPNSLSEDEIYDLIKDFKYVIPGGSILYGVGNKYSITSLGNCFVIGDQTDSYGSILKIDEEQVQLMKRRGGVGHDLSHLRPKGSLVNNSATTSTGAVSFMSRYSNSTREVAQGGRRGALMLTMNVDHPDILDFIKSKDDLTKLTGANISVKLTNQFMCRINDQILYWPKEREIWDIIVHQAWKNGEPGVLFWDTIINNSPADKYSEFKSISTNPCGEIPLCAYDTCRLTSINLFSFVEDPFTAFARFDFEKFKGVVVKAQRLMDDVVDLEAEKIDEILDKIGTQEDPNEDDYYDNHREVNLWYKIKEKLLRGRRTGLSVIGLADCFAALNLKYGSEKAILFADSLFNEFHDVAYKSSEKMAKERGEFSAWDIKIDEIPRRNIALLTIPPSGTISIMAGVTSGIEPVFNLSYTRRRKVDESDNIVFIDKNGDKWEEYTVYHPKYIEFNKPSIYEGCTANEIDPISRVELQATVQQYIDHSISSTINLPKETTEQQIADIYMTAWKLGCKGITIYREGCRDGVLINKDEKKLENEFKQHNAPKRPKDLISDVKNIKIKGNSFCVVIGLFDNKPYEVFVRDNKWPWDVGAKQPDDGKYFVVKESSGRYMLCKDKYIYGTLTEMLSPEEGAITRLVSTALRHGTDVKFIVEQLNKIHGDLTSFSKAIARVLKNYVNNGSHLKGSDCSNCGSKLIIENGCEICKSCGSTKCG